MRQSPPPNGSSGQTRLSRPWYGPVLLGGALYVIILAFRQLAPILLSCLLVVFFTLALQPVITGVKRWCGSRRAAVAIVMGTIILVTGAVTTSSYLPMKEAGSSVFLHLSKGWKQVQQPTPLSRPTASTGGEATTGGTPADKTDHAGTSAATQPARAPGDSDGNPSLASPPLRNMLKSLFDSAAVSIKDIAVNTTTCLIIGVTVFVGIIFTLPIGNPSSGRCLPWSPRLTTRWPRGIVRRIVRFMPRWAMATVIAMGAVGTLVFLATCPLFGIGHALTLGLTVATFGVLGVLVAVPLVGIARILHEELYRPRFLPDVPDADLDRLAETAFDPAPRVDPRSPLAERLP